MSKIKGLKNHVRKKIDLKNSIAKNITEKYFDEIWDHLYAMNEIEKMNEKEIAKTFFNQGVIEALNHEDKDYAELKEKKKIEQMKKLKAERMIKDIKKELFKIDSTGKLNIKEAIKKLIKAREEHLDDDEFIKMINDEIEFLNDYRLKRE
jgi:Glu-tRNA(Gln) amidotransferase subunit E-like FAD-binding protein